MKIINLCGNFNVLREYLEQLEARRCIGSDTVCKLFNSSNYVNINAIEMNGQLQGIIATEDNTQYLISGKQLAKEEFVFYFESGTELFNFSFKKGGNGVNAVIYNVVKDDTNAECTYLSAAYSDLDLTIYEDQKLFNELNEIVYSLYCKSSNKYKKFTREMFNNVDEIIQDFSIFEYDLMEGFNHCTDSEFLPCFYILNEVENQLIHYYARAGKTVVKNLLITEIALNNIIDKCINKTLPDCKDSDRYMIHDIVYDTLIENHQTQASSNMIYAIKLFANETLQHKTMYGPEQILAGLINTNIDNFESCEDVLDVLSTSLETNQYFEDVLPNLSLLINRDTVLNNLMYLYENFDSVKQYYSELSISQIFNELKFLTKYLYDTAQQNNAQSTDNTEGELDDMLSLDAAFIV